MSQKLMLLGGARYLLPVIEVAHELDCRVITCDYLPHNIAHSYSDMYVNVSIINKEDVLHVAEELQIDGIMSFACDPGVTTAAYVAEKMGLPSCGPYESVSILQNKRRFRHFLTEYGFNVPWSYGYANKGDALLQSETFEYPVMVKPADSAGSKGVQKVEVKGQLKGAIECALENSHCGEFVIEQFLECDGYASDSECFSVDGKLVFVSYSAQRFDDKSANPYTPAGFTWTPSISESNQRLLTKELQRLLSLLNMRTALYNVESRQCIDGKAYLMEVSPRGGGNRLAEMLRFATGTDLISSAVKAAIGVSVESRFEERIKGNWAEIILHGRKPGRFEEIQISEELKDSIVEQDMWIHKGDYIKPFTGANMTIGTIVLNFLDRNLMDVVMRDPYRFIDIVTED